MTSEATSLALNDATRGDPQSIDFEGTVNGILWTQRVTTFEAPRTTSAQEINEFTSRIAVPLAGGGKTAIATSPEDIQDLLFSHKASRCWMWQTARQRRTAQVTGVLDRDQVVFRVMYAPPARYGDVIQARKAGFDSHYSLRFGGHTSSGFRAEYHSASVGDPRPTTPKA